MRPKIFPAVIMIVAVLRVFDAGAGQDLPIPYDTDDQDTDEPAVEFEVRRPDVLGDPWEDASEFRPNEREIRAALIARMPKEFEPATIEVLNCEYYGSNRHSCITKFVYGGQSLVLNVSLEKVGDLWRFAN